MSANKTAARAKIPAPRCAAGSCGADNRRADKQWALQDSNLRPLASEAPLTARKIKDFEAI